MCDIIWWHEVQNLFFVYFFQQRKEGKLFGSHNKKQRENQPYLCAQWAGSVRERKDPSFEKAYKGICVLRNEPDLMHRVIRQMRCWGQIKGTHEDWSMGDEGWSGALCTDSLMNSIARLGLVDSKPITLAKPCVSEGSELHLNPSNGGRRFKGILILTHWFLHLCQGEGKLWRCTLVLTLLIDL